MENIDKTRNFFLEEMKQSELMNKKHKRVCANLNYIEHFLISASTITGCILIFSFTSLIGIPIGVMRSAIKLKFLQWLSIINSYKTIIKKKNKKHDRIVLLAKSKLNKIELIIFKDLIDSVISLDEFFLINNVLKE